MFYLFSWAGHIDQEEPRATYHHSELLTPLSLKALQVIVGGQD